MQVFMYGQDNPKSTTVDVLFLSEISVMKKTCISTAFQVLYCRNANNHFSFLWKRAMVHFSL